MSGLIGSLADFWGSGDADPAMGQKMLHILTAIKTQFSHMVF